MQPFDVAVGLRAAGTDLSVRGALRQPGGELAPPELVAIVGEHALQVPTGALELCGDPAGQRGGLLDGRSRRWADDEIGPRERVVGVDRGDLPDRTLGAVQAADKEAVIPTSSPGRALSMWGSGAGSRGG